MWQLYSLCAIVSNTLEETIDKATMLRSSTLDTVAAAWLRNIVVFGIAILAATLLQHSFPPIIASFAIALWGFLYAVQAISYTFILKHVELTAASVTIGLLPLVFLPIDLFVTHAPISVMQIAGIIVLVAGGIVFFLRRDMREKLLTRSFLFMLLSLLTFDALIFGSESYIFKGYFAREGLMPASFLVSGMLYMCIFLTIFLAVHALRMRGNISLLGAWRYTRGSMLAKCADYGNIFFSLQALTIASVSQVAAMKVIHPVALLLVTMITQHTLKVNLDEMFTRDTIVQKTLGILLIVIGSFMIR